MKNYNSVLIIYNPNALKGKVDTIIPYVKQRLFLRFSQVDAMPTPNQEGAEGITMKYAPKYDIIVACGGDGTLHQVVNGVMKSGADAVVGLLPFGTCNDVARTLKIPFKLDKAIDTILKLNINNYDLMFDGEKYITYSLAAGYLTKCSYSASNKLKRRIGRGAYILSGLKNIFKFKALPITITCDGERIHDKFLYMMLVNGESTGGFKLNKGDEIDNGKVKVILVKKSRFIGSLWAFVRMFMFGVKAVQKSKYVIVREAKHIQIENHANTPFTLDGEKTKFLKKDVKIVSDLKMIIK